MARPTDYKEEYVALAEQYIINHESKGDPVPTVDGLADELGVTKKTLYNWSEVHPLFLHALERLKAKQGRLLQALGLSNKTNPAITKLMLSANHGMAEKTEQDVTSKGDKVSGFVVEFVKNAEKSPISTET